MVTLISITGIDEANNPLQVLRLNDLWWDQIEWIAERITRFLLLTACRCCSDSPLHFFLWIVGSNSVLQVGWQVELHGFVCKGLLYLNFVVDRSINQAKDVNYPGAGMLLLNQVTSDYSILCFYLCIKGTSIPKSNTNFINFFHCFVAQWIQNLQKKTGPDGN